MPLKPRKPSPQIFALCSLFTLTTFLLSLSSFNAASAQTQGSTTAASDDPKADEKITALIEGENALAAHAIFNSRIEYASEKFIGAPYLTKGPLGEGPTGKYDQDPLYRTDGFDCTTFVETMISIARAQSFSEFQIQQNLIRYDQGTVDFTHRNHFVEVDWSPNNIQAGLFSDITNSITTSAQRGIAVRTISKKDWYAHLPISKLHLLNTTGVDLNALLDSLHSEGNQMPDVVSQLPYVKKEAFFAIQNKLPTPSVLNIIRNEPIDGSTTLYPQVTHQVLLLAKNRQYRVRQASSLASNKKVIDQPLNEFIQELLASDSVIGVNVMKATPPAFLSRRITSSRPRGLQKPNLAH